MQGLVFQVGSFEGDATWQRTGSGQKKLYTDLSTLPPLQMRSSTRVR